MNTTAPLLSTVLLLFSTNQSWLELDITGTNRSTTNQTWHEVGENTLTTNPTRLELGENTLTTNQTLLELGENTLTTNQTWLELGENTLTTNQTWLELGENTLTTNLTLLELGENTLTTNPTRLELRENTLATNQTLLGLETAGSGTDILITNQTWLGLEPTEISPCNGSEENKTTTSQNVSSIATDVPKLPHDYVFLNGSSIDKYFYKEASSYILTVIMPVILVVGVLCNGGFMFVFARIPSMRTVTSYYLLNLAIADFIYLSFVVSDKLIRYNTSPFSADYSVWGPYACKMITGFIFVPHYISELTISLFTFERYIAICQPLKRAYFCSKKRTVFYIICIWIVSGILAIPCLLFIDGKTFHIIWSEPRYTSMYPNKIHKCGVSPIGFGGSVTLQCYAFQTIPFLFSAIITAILNTYMIKAINKSARDSIKMGASKGSKMVQNRKDIIRMLVVTSVIFYLCVFPYFVDDILYAVAYVSSTKPIQLPSEFLQVGRFLAYTNSAVNPIVYNLLSSRYRRATLQAFCSCCYKPKQIKEDSNSINQSQKTKANIDENGGDRSPSIDTEGRTQMSQLDKDVYTIPSISFHTDSKI